MKIGKTPGSVGGAGSASGSSSTAGAQRSGGAASAAPTGASANTSGAAQADSAKVTLSPVAAQLQAALAASGSGEVFDTKQVASIKQAISNGSFQVNPEKVADKLIQSVQEMLNARGGRQSQGA